MLSNIRRRLGVKLFLSYLVVILVGVFVLGSTVELVVPTAFQRHMVGMDEMMPGMMGAPPDSVNQNLYTSFRSAVEEALGLAILAATGMAIIVSVLVSRQVVAPIRAMTLASQRIAEGHYEERVRVGREIIRGEQDELGQLALSFNQMAAKLARTEVMRSQLIGDVTHELRTPLTAIKGYMEGLIDGVMPGSDENYTQIFREADRLQRLVDDLQELSRVEAGAYELHFSQNSVKVLVDAVVDRLGRQFEEKNVSLSVDIPSDLPSVEVDADRIGQVLINLVGNALQFTPSGGKVHITTRLEQDAIKVAVSDTGIGIPPEHLPHLFTRFYRVEKSRSRSSGGSGIGLTIAKHLVDAHGGFIRAESAGSGKGSTFTFSIPVAR